MHGDVLGLRLSTESGREEEFKNLTETIRIVIPNKKKIAEPEPVDTAYCSLMKKIHSLDCKVNESVLILHVKPHFYGNDGDGLKLFVFMNKGTLFL